MAGETGLERQAAKCYVERRRLVCFREGSKLQQYLVLNHKNAELFRGKAVFQFHCLISAMTELAEIKASQYATLPEHRYNGWEYLMDKSYCSILRQIFGCGNELESDEHDELIDTQLLRADGITPLNLAEQI